jgi:tRNA_anti-like
MLERGLDVIGYHNIFVGGGLFLGAFICFLTWFVKHERARKWRLGVRVTIALIAAIVYFSFIGRQIYKQYSVEASPVSSVTNAPQLQSQPQASTRPFVDVDVAYLATLYRTHSSAQADVVAKDYVGKWIKTTGAVNDVKRDQFLGSESAYVTIQLPTKEALGMYVIFAKFSQPSFMERALTLNRGELVSIVGRIHKADNMGLVLEECEIVP